MIPRKCPRKTLFQHTVGGQDIGQEIVCHFWMGQVFNIQISWLFPPNCVLGGGKIIFYNCFIKMIKIWNKKNSFDFFWLKIAKIFFFLNIKTKVLVIFLKKDCSQLSFLVHILFFVAQKLKILENMKQFFLAWTLVTSATSISLNFDLASATSIGSQILAGDTSFHMKYCLLTKMKIWML